MQAPGQEPHQIVYEPSQKMALCSLCTLGETPFPSCSTPGLKAVLTYW